jgi:uncharacterized lipoprotein YmbA
MSARFAMMPKHRSRLFAWVLCVPCVLGLLPGCTLLRGPKKDRTEFFALEAVAPAAATANPAAPRVLLRSVELPAYLQRSKALAVRRPDGAEHYADLAWWSEPLDLGLARVLRDNLNRLGVPTVARRDEDFADELTVHIERAEGVTDGKAGRLEFSATFELHRGDGARPAVIRRTFTAEAVAWDGKDYAALAKAMGKAAADLAAAIVAVLPAR